MRCLYCGKELALLKRWTGGGEFCSDAHRQRYQEEYNQLALNRLLQAKPPGKANETTQPSEPKPAKPIPAAEPAQEVTSYHPPRIAVPPPEPAPLTISEGTRTKQQYYEPRSPVAVHETVVDSKPPVVSAPVGEDAPLDEPAPAEAAGFLVEMPIAAIAEVAPMSRPGLEFLEAVAAALPNRVIELLNLGQDTQLETAGLLTYEPTNRASNYAVSGRERKLEVRDFVRSAPVVEIELSPAGETGLETSSEAMDILVFPQPPQGLPVLWQGPAVGFSEGGTELGHLARLSFSTTGFSGEEESSETDYKGATEIWEAPVVAELPQNGDLSHEFHADAVVEAVPAPVEEAKPELEPEVEPEVEAVVEPEAEKVTVPELVTKPLPLLLHATAPGKGKLLQVFSAAANPVEAVVPRSTSLPLRSVMTFGPAPTAIKNEAKTEAKSETKPEPKSEPKKPVAAPVRPDPRVASGKFRAVAPEVKVPMSEPAKQAAKAEAPSTAKTPPKADAKQDKKPEVKETLKSKEEQRTAPAPPAPLASPYSGSNDLGLPQLNLQSSPGFLGQVPLIAKIGIALVLLAALGGLIAYSSKSGGAATSTRGAIVAGSALPAGEAGWITDWGADPGVRRTRQISILRSSQTLTDYRIEMEGQIESKAIGWVFRAADPKNFYVTKLEIVKPGLEPTVALVRFAIINGEEQAHAQLPLPMKVRLDTMYKIRFDAVGDHFTTYVQDQKIDDWTDDHVKTGGVGFYRERGEDATLKGGMNVVPLIVRK